MSFDVWTAMLTSNPILRNKSLRARNKVAHVELLREFARPVPQYAVTVTYGNIKVFLSSEKRAKLETKNFNTDFRKVFFLTKYRMCYAIYTPPNTKGLAINQTMSVYENWQNATMFKQANNSDLLRSLKHLMKTRPYSEKANILILVYKSFLHRSTLNVVHE